MFALVQFVCVCVQKLISFCALSLLFHLCLHTTSHAYTQCIAATAAFFWLVPHVLLSSLLLSAVCCSSTTTTATCIFSYRCGAAKKVRAWTAVAAAAFSQIAKQPSQPCPRNRKHFARYCFFFFSLFSLAVALPGK